MTDRMHFDYDVKYLLRMASSDNPKYAYLAGEAMEDEGYHPFYVQVMYRCAADGGYSPAKRWLGILGLCHQLLDKDSGFSEKRCCQGYDEAIAWLKKASSQKDRISACILAKCHELGVGMEADETAAADEMRKLDPPPSDREKKQIDFCFEAQQMGDDREALTRFRGLCRSALFSDLNR